MKSLIPHANCTENTKQSIRGRQGLDQNQWTFNLLVVDGTVLAIRSWTMSFVLLFFDWSITLSLTHSTTDGSSRIPAGQEGWRWKTMPITNYKRGLFALWFLPSTCYVCNTTFKKMYPKMQHSTNIYCWCNEILISLKFMPSKPL